MDTTRSQAACCYARARQKECRVFRGGASARWQVHFFFREENVFNADSTWNFLKKLRRVACAGKKKAVIGIDNARYHHAIMHKKWREKVSCNFILEYLPPYSPELNPIERVWKLMRRLRLHNRYFPKLEDVFLATESLFKTWQNGAEDLKRLCRI